MCLDIVATLGVLCVPLYLTSPPDMPFSVSPSKSPKQGGDVPTQNETGSHAWGGPGSIRRLGGVHWIEWGKKGVHSCSSSHYCTYICRT